MLERDIAPFDVAKSLETLEQRPQIRSFLLSIARVPKYSDPREFPGLLSLGGVRRSKEHRPRTREERSAGYHWVSLQAICGGGLYGAWTKQIDSKSR
jgi:hypothetical protein